MGSYTLYDGAFALSCSMSTTATVTAFTTRSTRATFHKASKSADTPKEAYVSGPQKYKMADLCETIREFRVKCPDSHETHSPCPERKSMPNMTGRPGYRKMEMIGRSSAPYLARTPCVPLFCTLFNRGGNRRAFRLPGAGGGSFPLYGGTFTWSYSVSRKTSVGNATNKGRKL